MARGDLARKQNWNPDFSDSGVPVPRSCATQKGKIPMFPGEGKKVLAPQLSLKPLELLLECRLEPGSTGGPYTTQYRVWP